MQDGDKDIDTDIDKDIDNIRDSLSLAGCTAETLLREQSDGSLQTIF